MIRARKREHLKNLIEACPSLNTEIIESASTDYRYRIVVPKFAFADALRDLALGLDWTNVKAEAEKHSAKVGADFCDALHETWGAFHRIQTQS